MHHRLNHKAALAATLLMVASLAGAQSAPDTTPSTPGKMNSTTSPNPLQVRPADGTPNSASGLQTPGTGTGSSRTMRNPSPAAEPAVNGTPSTAPMPASELTTEPMATPSSTTRPARRDRG